MPDSAHRARIERLLRGDLRADDLTRLFLFARDRCDGRESVQEVGDFVAHHDERTKGLVTRTARDWEAIIQGILPTVEPKKVDYTRLPPRFREGMRAAIARLDAKQLRGCGLNKKEANDLLPGFLKRFITNPDRSISVPILIAAKEQRLLRAAFLVNIHPAFDDHRLFDDFVATMRSHGLLQQNEIRAFAALQPAIGLFAASVMQNCVVIGTWGERMPLQIRVNPGDPLEVLAETKITLRGGMEIPIVSPIYSTHLESASACDPEVLTMPVPITCPLELTPQMRLSRIN